MTEPTTLGSRYEIGDVLGRGGMAEVHVGRDARLGRQVAIKMLRVDLARDPTFQARFRREAQSAASLNHPAIVAVYDTGEDSVNGASVPYIVMEYVEGSTLRDLLNSGRRLLPERALEIVGGVLDALDYSHRHGIVHRDIKPANVMLTRAGDIKVMDFGIARAVADASVTMTQTSAVIGTAQYLSPEQARGETVDARSDLYSTGCLLYELLTGRPPFVGDSPVAVAYQHVREEPLPPSSIDPDVPPEIDAIVLKALVKDKEQRYASAAEMRADIDRALAGRPVEAPAVAPVTQRLAAVPAAPATSTMAAVPADRSPRTGRYVLLLFGVLAVFLLAAALGRELFGDDDSTRVAVPPVEGLLEPQARTAIADAGLVVGDRTEEFSDEEPGTVLTQRPPANTAVEEQTAVAIVVSQGQELTTVPTLVGLTLDQAREDLGDTNLELGDIVPQDSPEPENRVLAADPEQGQEVPVGSPVTLTVASGSTEVPGVVGRSAGDALSELQSAGFEVEVAERPDPDAEPGTVLEQAPEAGESRGSGTTVTITVATTPPAPTAPPDPDPDEEVPPPAGGDGGAGNGNENGDNSGPGSGGD